MAKGFGKGFVTGVAGTVAAVAGAVYTFKKKVIEPEEQKAAFIEENRKKQHVAVSHTNHSKAPETGAFAEKSPFWKIFFLVGVWSRYANTE